MSKKKSTKQHDCQCQLRELGGRHTVVLEAGGGRLQLADTGTPWFQRTRQCFLPLEMPQWHLAQFLKCNRHLVGGQLFPWSSLDTSDRPYQSTLPPLSRSLGPATEPLLHGILDHLYQNETLCVPDPEGCLALFSSKTVTLLSRPES